MKKIFSAFVIAVCCMFMAMPAQAQLLKWGVKGGVNMTKIDWDGGYKGNKDNSTGFFIGPMAEFTIPIVGLGVDGALLFSQRGKLVGYLYSCRSRFLLRLQEEGLRRPQEGSSGT